MAAPCNDNTVSNVFSDRILAWYHRHARTLPWRISPQDRAAGITPDPYRVWMSEIMLQQTTVATVKAYFERFTHRWPGVADLAAAPREDVLAEWAGLGYYARARNLHACAQEVMATHNGLFPPSEAALRTLPGVGQYTAAAVASIAFDARAVVVDGNVERVMARYFAVEDALPGAKKALYARADSVTPQVHPGDYAQAVMDLGATICTPRNPACGLCPVMEDCAGRLAGIAADLPRKAPKKAKPTRYGTCYLAMRPDGAILLATRPDTGLLGGMTELPGGDWTEDADAPLPPPPLAAHWRAGGQVRHTFTHFHLVLTVLRADVGQGANAERGIWTPRPEVTKTALPTLMRKALKAGLMAE